MSHWYPELRPDNLYGFKGADLSKFKAILLEWGYDYYDLEPFFADLKNTDLVEICRLRKIERLEKELKELHNRKV